MKRSTQINGLPIISISDGSQVGKVKSLVINPDKGSVDFLTIEHEDFQVSVKAIPFKKVVGIGEYAVTVDSENAIIDLNEIPIANQLVNKKIKITNTKVMTRKGELLGDVLEYYVDQETGHILGMQLKIENAEIALASESVVTFGKDIIIVKEDAASRYLKTVEELELKEVLVEELFEHVVEKVNNFDSLIQDLTPSSQLQAEKDIDALKEKQVEILGGKKVIKDIYDKNGNVLFVEGKVLNANDIKRAQAEGPSIVLELSMNVEA